ncbi:MAG: insulinase family protein [Muribaculaceae bacterium]|nr:insulinase family protein [Muribaculaceae bacterium]
MHSKIIKEQNTFPVTLSNGLRVVCRKREGLVSYIGIVVNAGSRDEDPEHEGLAHFVEHTIFKGTDKRRAWQISARMEVVGGELNAYTSKEETMVYTNAPAGYEERALELLGDLVTSSRFPSPDIDKEREVIVEEIYSYLDNPAERVYDEFEELAYKGSGLSHNILGSPESVRKITGTDCRGFIDRFYQPENMVLYCVTPLSDKEMMRKVEKYFGEIPSVKVVHDRILPPPMEHFDVKRDHGTHQANTIMGSRAFGRNDERRFALFLLNNYLAGPCLNSKLNRELREKKGYVYAVDSNVSLLSNTGLLVIYFGCDPVNVSKCRKVIQREVEILCGDTMKDSAFEKIKRQYCGQLLASSDQIENRAMSLGKSVLYFNKVHDISTTAERIMAVTPAEMREVAEFIFSPGLSVLTLT